MGRLLEVGAGRRSRFEQRHHPVDVPAGGLGGLKRGRQWHPGQQGDGAAPARLGLRRQGEVQVFGLLEQPLFERA